MLNNKKLTYAAAGVDVDAYEEAKDEFAQIISDCNSKSPYADCVVAGLGTFGSVFDTKKAASKLGFKNYADVESVDSVGTKISVAVAMDRYDTIGLDMLGHSCNDILVQGAIPLVFGDYLAFSKFDKRMVIDVVKGVAQGCEAAGMILHFGETAELPGVYQEGELDLVGTVRGVVDLDNVITGAAIQPGDVIIGVASNGLHTNGYSLARKVLFEKKDYKVTDTIDELGGGGVLGDVLLKPHTNYLHPLKELFQRKIINGISHLTGGGFKNNIIRILPAHCQAKISLGSWEVLPIFKLIQKDGGIEDSEMYKTFNMGIGIVIACQSENEKTIREVFAKHNMKTFNIGGIGEGPKDVLFE